MRKEYKIAISPEILELLGPNLYTNIYYVLAELIANAYDADARNVYVIKEASAIIVEDDGIGMDYENGIKRYLQVAEPTRTDEKSSITALGRRRMGRKGIGKLAALSVSSRVKVITRSGLDTSGFILSRSVPEDGILEPLDDSEMIFHRIDGNGTSIVMENPEYELNKTLESWKHNLLRLFPIVSQDFRIHLVQDTKELVLDSFDRDIIPQLSTLITVGSEFEPLELSFPAEFPEILDKVRLHLDDHAVEKTVAVDTRDGKKRDCAVSIRGWIGTYRSVKGRKKSIGDFPDNFISLFANGKLGAFNIIPEIGRNRMSESYIVGQLHIDSFEDSDLPDMAMSNRQGYKSDDIRYQTAIQLIREKLFDEVLRLRDIYTGKKKAEKKTDDLNRQKQEEDKLKEAASSFVSRIQSSVSSLPAGQSISNQTAKKMVDDATSLLGLKRIVDSSKKRLLISHAECDKEIADLIYDLLVDNNVRAEQIIYTSSENEKSRIPEGVPIYDYLRSFFVQSLSTQMLNVIFVTSDASACRWAPVCEVGAAWITRAQHKIFTINGSKPQSPLDVAPEWLNFKVDEEGIHLSKRDADVLKVKTREVCRLLGVTPRPDSEIASFIETRVLVE